MPNPNPSPATRFREGQSGNPGGRPRGRTLTSIIRDVLDSDTLKGTKVPAGCTVADVLAEMFVKQALKGRFPFAKEVIDRIDGKIGGDDDRDGDRPAPHEIPDADPRLVGGDERPPLEGDPGPDARG